MAANPSSRAVRVGSSGSDEPARAPAPSATSSSGTGGNTTSGTGGTNDGGTTGQGGTNTGGTTGMPKVAQHTHAGMIYNGWLGDALLFVGMFAAMFAANARLAAVVLVVGLSLAFAVSSQLQQRQTSLARDEARQEAQVLVGDPARVAACGKLHVLVLQCLLDVGNSDVLGGHGLSVEPDPHGVAASAADKDPSDAIQHGKSVH